MPKKSQKTEGEQIKQEIEETAAYIGRYARKMLTEAIPANDHADALLTMVRDEPVKTSLIALGVGFVLGMIVRR